MTIRDLGDLKELAQRIRNEKGLTGSAEELEASRRAIKERYYNGICQPFCSVCNGVGYVSTGDFGKIEPCPKISKPRIVTDKYGLTGPEIENLGWTALYATPSAKRAVDTILTIMKRGYGMALLYGDYGVGKTTMLKTAVASALRQNMEAAYVEMTEILDNLRDGFNAATGEMTETDRMRFWSDIYLLSIDEFDKTRTSEYIKERTFHIMNKRYSSALRKETVTLLAMNGEPSDLPDYLHDRLRDGRFNMIQIKDASFRPSMDWPNEHDILKE